LEFISFYGFIFIVIYLLIQKLEKIMTNIDKTADFLTKGMVSLCNLNQASGVKVLDLGYGMGELVKSLVEQGYDAYGCDIEELWIKNPEIDCKRLAKIPLSPYKLPYPDDSFDVIVSTVVLEHVQNIEEVFKEIHRVLKIGGYSMHLFPAKWYLPSEPHIFVPLVNFFWPRVRVLILRGFPRRKFLHNLCGSIDLERSFSMGFP
jgi:ubiquinone/menaquinone biosynthesis C-methylase UbiE